MTFDVFLIENVEQDLIDIYSYIAEESSRSSADKVIDRIESQCSTLSSMPSRGRIPPELISIGILNYHEVHCSPYRIIYEIIGKEVYVHCILDSRRSLSDLLFKRLVLPSNDSIN